MTDSLQKKLSDWKQNTADSDNLSENFKIGYVLAINATLEAVRDIASSSREKQKFMQFKFAPLHAEFKGGYLKALEEVLELFVGSSKEA